MSEKETPKLKMVKVVAKREGFYAGERKRAGATFLMPEDVALKNVNKLDGQGKIKGTWFELVEPVAQKVVAADSTSENKSQGGDKSQGGNVSEDGDDEDLDDVA